MKPSRIRQPRSGRRVPVGHMLMEFEIPGIAMMCEAAGLDFVLIDMEHGPFEIPQVARMIAAFKATEISPLVRIPASEYHFVSRVMDAGAHGIMAPNVRSPEQARLLNSSMRYAPEGNRGLGLGSAHNDYVRPDSVAYMAEANRRNVLICQIESVTALECLDEIAAVPGVDCLWVGQMDLTQSMGIVGQFRHPDFLAALEKVAETASATGKFAGIQPGSPEQAREWMEIGYNVVSYSTDLGVYGEALADGAGQVRRLVPGS